MYSTVYHFSHRKESGNIAQFCTNILHFPLLSPYSTYFDKMSPDKKSFSFPDFFPLFVLWKPVFGTTLLKVHNFIFVKGYFLFSPVIFRLSGNVSQPLIRFIAVHRKRYLDNLIAAQQNINPGHGNPQNKSPHCRAQDRAKPHHAHVQNQPEPGVPSCPENPHNHRGIHRLPHHIIGHNQHHSRQIAFGQRGEIQQAFNQKCPVSEVPRRYRIKQQSLQSAFRTLWPVPLSSLRWPFQS